MIMWHLVVIRNHKNRFAFDWCRDNLRLMESPLNPLETNETKSRYVWPCNNIMNFNLSSKIKNLFRGVKGFSQNQWNEVESFLSSFLTHFVCYFCSSSQYSCLVDSSKPDIIFRKLKAKNLNRFSYPSRWWIKHQPLHVCIKDEPTIFLCLDSPQFNLLFTIHLRMRKSISMMLPTISNYPEFSHKK